MNRPSWDEYFMEAAILGAKMSTCQRRKVGAVVVKDKRILVTGFNGPPPKLKHCDELDGCMRIKMDIPSGERAELCRALHAEQNCIIQSSKTGVPLIGGTMYVTITPCIICVKEIISAGIIRVIFSGDYPEQIGLKMLEEANVEMIRHQHS